MIAQRCLKWMKNVLPEQELEACDCCDIIFPLYSARDVSLIPYVFHENIHSNANMSGGKTQDTKYF